VSFGVCHGDRRRFRVQCWWLGKLPLSAAKRFFKRVLHSSPVPRKIVTDHLRSYPAAKAAIPNFCERDARVRQSGRPTEQPRREASVA